MIYSGEPERAAEAVPLLEEAVALAAAADNPVALGERHPRTAASMQNIALSISALGRGSEAEPLYREVLDIYREALGEDHTEVATTLTTLGWLMTERGDHDDAVPLLKEAIRINRARLGDEHPNVALALNDLGTLHARQGRLEEAAQLFEQAWTCGSAPSARTIRMSPSA